MKKMDTYLKLSPVAAARINNIAEHSIQSAVCRLPMVVVPVPWQVGMTDGGGYLTSFSPLTLFKTRNRALLQEIRGITDPEFQHFVDGHNAAAQTGHCIDRETLKLLKLLINQPRQYAALPKFTTMAVECPLVDDDVVRAAEVYAERRAVHDAINRACVKLSHKIPGCSLDDEKAEIKERMLAEHKAKLTVHDETILALYTQWRLDKAAARKQAVEQAGAQSNLLRTLEIATDLQHYTSIYFPTQSDDRGRVYYATPLLNPQGADHEKALLLFDTAKEIGVAGWDWLRINLSNLMGNDKANYANRIAYVEAHREMIESCVADPLHDFRWEATDKPFQFLQAAREIVQAWRLDDPTKFKSRVGVACDASCSGLQILGTITRCESSMRFTNCLPAQVNSQGEEFMQDIYGEAARISGLMMREVVEGKRDARAYKEVVFKEPKQLRDALKNKLRRAKALAKFEQEKAAQEAQRRSDIEHAKKLLSWSAYAMKDEHSFTRNWLKRNTMTFFYGSANFGMRDQLIVDHIEPEYRAAVAIVGKDGDLSSVGFPWQTLKDATDAATVAANINYAAICAMADKPAKVMQVLQRFAELIAKSGRKMRWTTPLGLIVEQRYEIMQKFKVDSLITGQVRMQTATQRSTGEVDANGQKNGAAPNWVHSYDASLLLKVLSLGWKSGLNHWRVVHDSFATHACDVPIMINLLKNTMADMLNKDVLVKTYNELAAQVDPEYKDEILEFPDLGDESLIDSLRRAQYPFC